MMTILQLVIVVALLITQQVLATTKTKEREKGRQALFNSNQQSYQPELEFRESNWVTNFAEPETSVTEQSDEEQTPDQHLKAPKMPNVLGIFNTAEIRNYLFEYGKLLLQQVVDKDYSSFLFPSFTTEGEGGGQEEEATGRTGSAGSNYVVRWLLSLVRQEGVSLPVFLRSYRVEILYDIVFYVIRWVFFAYLAFLYP